MKACPKCNSENIMKNGSIHNGKSKYQCNNCGQQFVENPVSNKIPQEKIDYVDRLLLDKTGQTH